MVYDINQFGLSHGRGGDRRELDAIEAESLRSKRARCVDLRLMRLQPMHIFLQLGDRFDVRAGCRPAELSGEKRERQDAARTEKPKNVWNGAEEDPTGARDAEVGAGLAALDEQSRGLHAFALDMCDEVAGKTVRLHKHARRVDAQTVALAEHTLRGGLAGSQKSFVTLALRAKQDVRRNHRRGQAPDPADRHVRRRSGEANGAEGAAQAP